MEYGKMSYTQLEAEYEAASRRFEELKGKGLKLDMSRGKPGKEQLDLVSDMLTVLSRPEDCVEEGVDVRNYGELTGLPCAKRYFAEILGCRPEECFIGGNASLNLMYDTIAKAYTHGLLHSEKPWSKLETVKFLCPSPGYDRHFNVTGSFGMELITIPMTKTGPDMDVVEEAVKDPAVKGIWCVPKYSNPEGIIYSPETIGRIAHLKPAAPDFVVMWDNAYCIHEFEGDYVPFPDIISLCREAGNPDMVFEYASTSKVTFPGAGISVMASSGQGQPAPPRPLPQGQSPYPGADEEARRHPWPQVPGGAGWAGPGDRPSGHRHLEAPYRRVLCQRGHSGRPRQAHAGSLPGGGSSHDQRRSHLP